MKVSTLLDLGLSKINVYVSMYMYSVYLWIMEPPQTILWLGKQLSDQTIADFEGNMPLLA